ncbi:hypothetical protein AB0J72_29520 [Dactylosporangium sp. NPDC049742]|uniref:hypothetical protein n=1 Tax=Dactylosporangium sp. NPDC049742 TaxID=3154737 RepID=UPI0034157684
MPDEGYYSYLRNRIGALLLLDGRDNGTYGGMLLEDKLVRYRKDTLLAGMLNPDFFERSNVRLREFLCGHGLLQMVATYDASTKLEPFIDARGRFYFETASDARATSPTKAMEHAVGVASNGWAFWQVERTRERLDTVRQRYLDQFER